MLKYLRTTTSLSRSQMQRGNIATVLFGAVAMVGIVSAATMQMISGPIRTASEVNNTNLVESQLIIAAKLIVIDASSLGDSGDVDADNTIEPREYDDTASPAPTGGGGIPSEVGAAQIDAWGTNYGYCVWDNGTVDNGKDDTGTGTDNRLNGNTDDATIVIALISAGPNRAFEAGCYAYDGSGDEGLVIPTGSDDLTFTYTYAEAATQGGSLWMINQDDDSVVELRSDTADPDSATVQINQSSGIGFFEGITTNLIAAKDDDTLEITASSGVGIGTDSPSAPLHVATGTPSGFTDTVFGAAVFERAGGTSANNTVPIVSGNAANAGISFGDPDNIDSGFLLYQNDTDGFLIGTNSSTRMAIDSSGDVGIGTTDPLSKLHIAPGNATATTIGNQDFNLGALVHTVSGRSGYVAQTVNDYLDVAGNNGHFVSLFPFDDSTSSNDGSWKAFRLMTGATLADAFWVNKYGGAYFDGDVGIGTASPNANLHISGDSWSSTRIDTYSDSSYSQFVGFRARGTESSPAAVDAGDTLVGFGGWGYDGSSWQQTGGIGIIAESDFDTEVSDYMRFALLDNGVWGEKMRITSTGDVGIGTTSPNDLLHLSSSAPGIRLSNTDGGVFGSINLRNDGALILQADRGNAGGSEIVFMNDGAHIAEFDSQGDLGIGTGDPFGRIHVFSNNGAQNNGNTTSPDALYDEIVVENSGASGMSILARNDATSGLILGDGDDNNIGRILYDHTGDDLSLWTNNAERMTILSDGKVGIGTTSPGDVLEIATGETNEFVGIGNVNEASAFPSDATSPTHGIGISRTSDGLYSSQIFGEGTNATNLGIKARNDINFYGNQTRNVTFKEDGDVGIGTDSPTVDLEIYKDSATNGPYLRLTNPNQTPNVFTGLLFRAADSDGNEEDFSQIRAIYTDFTADSEKGDLAFLTRDTSLLERMRITSTGNVGIGTSSPDNTLHVVGNADIDGNLYVSKTGGAGGKIVRFYHVTDEAGTIGVGAGGGGITLGGTSFIRFDLDSGTGKIHINDDGVGIGTTSPNTELDVNGDVTATSYLYSSDRRLKENITPLDDALDRITQLEGVRFDWKDPEKGDGPQIGFIAQDVEKVYPELVRGTEDHKTVNYAAIVAPLVEAVKELRAENEALKARLDALEQNEQ